MNADVEVCVVTVTYGSRWHLLRQVLRAILDHDPRIRRVVVVDNGSMYDVTEATQELGRKEIFVVRLPQNQGSAVGFATGINRALASAQHDFIWLLDDDNIPAAGTLTRLLDAYFRLGGDWRNAMLAIRPRSREYKLASLGLMDICIRTNSFAGFHIASLPEKVIRRFRERQIGRDTAVHRRHELVQVGYAPYGGLLLHRELVKVIGLPRSDYFLYADDYEYTTRIPLQKGKIYLCADAEVHDLETSWHLQRRRVSHLFDREADTRRLYFAVRNRVQLEVMRFVTSKPMYWVNAIILLGGMALQSFLVDRRPAATLRRLKFIRTAVLQGVAGQLGKEIPASVRV